MRHPVDAERIFAFVRRLGAEARELELNVELAAPDQFIPEVPGWRERSRFVVREEIAPQLYRFPAIDPPAFRRAVEEAVAAP
jgi:hypothetical protein